MHYLNIDGSYLEGGGQIVRTALGLSTLLGIGCKIKNIRKGRKKPGLKPQHLSILETYKQISNSKTNNIILGSTDLIFNPGKIKSGKYSVDIGSAGSISLFLQSLLIPLSLCKCRIDLNIIGGTDVNWSPQIDYFTKIFLPQLNRLTKISLKLNQRGYYPKGGGSVDLKIRTKRNFDNSAQKYNLSNQGNLIALRGVSHASINLEQKNVAERQAAAAKNKLKSLNVPITIMSSYYNTQSTGSGITLYAVFSNAPDDIDIHNPKRIGSDILGVKGISAEIIGERAADALIEEINKNACVDLHLADMLIPYLNIIGGEIKTSKITNHTLTNIHITEMFLKKKFKIDNTLIKC